MTRARAGSCRSCGRNLEGRLVCKCGQARDVDPATDDRWCSAHGRFHRCGIRRRSRAGGRDESPSPEIPGSGGIQSQFPTSGDGDS